MSSTGCDEIDARRKVQEAGKLYERGEFAEAAELYEQVLQKFDTGDVAEVAHYNAGITYNKMFRPGLDTPDNQRIAAATTSHFASYLEYSPGDSTIIGLMTQVWLDSGQYESAIRYWEREHAKNSSDAEIIGILAGIHRQAGDWEKAVEWHYKEADVLSTPGAKSNAYANVGKLTSNRLFNRTGVVWSDRLRAADIGIAALQKAVALTPDNHEIHTYLGILYSLRSEAHQASWAQVIDKSHGQYHHSRSAALKKAAEGAPAQPSEPGSGGEPAGEPSGDGKGEAKEPASDEPGEQGAADDATSPEGGNPTRAASAGVPGVNP